MNKQAATAWGWVASAVCLSGVLFVFGAPVFWAIALGLFVTICNAWSMHGKEPLSRTDLGKTVLAAVIILPIFLLVDAHISGVNLFDYTQWPNLWKSGALGFFVTATVACSFISIITATAVRLALVSPSEQ